MVADWRERIVAEAKSWLWTPYRHRGRVKGVGVDCGGLLYEVYNPIFGPFEAFPDYPADWSLHQSTGNERYLSFIFPMVTQVPKPLKGSFTLFKVGQVYSHAAIWTGKSYIHAWGNTKDGLVREDPPRFFFDAKWVSRKFKHYDLGAKWRC